MESIENFNIELKYFEMFFFVATFSPEADVNIFQSPIWQPFPSKSTPLSGGVGVMGFNLKKLNFYDNNCVTLCVPTKKRVFFVGRQKLARNYNSTVWKHPSVVPACWLAGWLLGNANASQPARRRRILGVGRGVHPELHPKLLFRPKEETIVLRFLGLKRGETKFESLEVPDWIAAICRQREVWRVVELGVCVCLGLSFQLGAIYDE